LPTSSPAPFALRLVEQRLDVVDLAVVPSAPIRPLEPQDRDVVGFRERLDLLPEPIAEALEQRRRRDVVSQVGREESHHLPPHLEVGDVGVEVDPVHTFEIEDDMAVEHVVDVDYVGHARSLHAEGSLGPTPRRHDPTARGDSLHLGGHWSTIPVIPLV
jgi:hypothetical protein